MVVLSAAVPVEYPAEFIAPLARRLCHYVADEPAALPLLYGESLAFGNAEIAQKARRLLPVERGLDIPHGFGVAEDAEEGVLVALVKGADIEITRSIPAGGGLGGSSADVAGVLLGMKKLYGVSRDMDNLASRLGSDTAYMLKGGYAVLKGRGEKIRSLPEIKKKFYLLIIACDKGVSSGECYAEFDRQGKKYPQRTGGAARLLAEGDTENFLKTLKNDLYLPACEFVPEIRDNVNALILYGAACMTGSGSAVYGIYPDKKTQNQVYKKLYPVYGKRLIKAKTII